MTSVAVVGAGLGGLVAAKELMLAGLKPTLFEQSSGLGGVWRIPDGAAWSGMRTNLSKYTCAFSDTPWPTGTAEFPAKEAVEGYLSSYATCHSLMANICFNCKVIDISSNRRLWRVSWIKNKKRESATFDGVVIASGIFARPMLPQMKDSARGSKSIVHSSEIANPDSFSGQRVAVVGASFSGYELAASLATSGAGVVHIVPRSCWVLPRYFPCVGAPIPLDLVLSRRDRRADSVDPKEAMRQRNHFFEGVAGNPGDANPALAIDCDRGDPTFVVISDSYLERVRTGSINVAFGRAVDIVEDKRGGAVVSLDNGERVVCDRIVACTGYRADLGFLEAPVRRVIHYQPEDLLQPVLLDQCTFHPDVVGLGFVGMYRDPGFGINELQARWIARVFAGDLAHPVGRTAWSELRKERAIRLMRPRPQFPRGNYVTLADKIAARIGVAPHLEPDDPYYDVVANGPVTPAQYRLTGPGSDPDTAHSMIRSLPRSY